MTYELAFDRRALKEWRKLDETLRRQFKARLEKILEQPRVEAHRLRGFPDCYRIKLRQSGYRLVYQVQDQRITVFVVAIGKRDRSQAYDLASQRLDNDI